MTAQTALFAPLPASEDVVIPASAIDHPLLRDRLVLLRGFRNWERLSPAERRVLYGEVVRASPAIRGFLASGGIVNDFQRLFLQQRLLERAAELPVASGSAL